MKLHVTAIIARVHWGYSVRTFPASASQRSFTVPPPTTIIGALAYAYATVNDINREYSEKDSPFTTYTTEFIEEYGVKYATVHLLESVGEHVFQTIRYFTMPVQLPITDIEKFSSHMRISEMFGPIQIGYVAYPQLNLILLTLSEKEIPKKVAWSLTRIGSKESIIYVESVTQGEVELKELALGSEYMINTYYHSDLAKPVSPSSYMIERMPMPLKKDERQQWYSFKPHPPKIERVIIVPLPPLYVYAKIIKNCYIATFNVNEKKIVMTVPKECVEQ